MRITIRLRVYGGTLIPHDPNMVISQTIPGTELQKKRDIMHQAKVMDHRYANDEQTIVFLVAPIGQAP